MIRHSTPLAGSRHLLLMLLLGISMTLVHAAGKSVATPTFTQTPGEKHAAPTVTIGCAANGAAIRYTTDGTNPTATSMLYRTPLLINSTTTVKARAFTTAGKRSAIATTVIPVESFIARSFANAAIMATPLPYRLHVPAHYDPRIAYPMVLFMHGSGEHGTDNEKQLLANHGATCWAEQTVYPCFVLAPQSPIGSWSRGGRRGNADGSDTLPRQQLLDMVMALLDSLRQEFHIDGNRIYCTGLSAGGMATWAINEAHPHYFAAAIPMAGSGDSSPKSVEPIKNKPIWIFHGAHDPTVSPEGAHRMRDALLAAGDHIGTATSSQFRYTEYTTSPGDQHDSWIPACKDADLFDWTFTKSLDTTLLPAPDILPAPGSITPIRATISSPAAGAVIRYTTNGREPTPSSPLYRQPFRLKHTTTVKARAYLPGKPASLTASRTYTIFTPAPIPGRIALDSYVAKNGFGIEECLDSDGGMDAGWTNAGNWLDYYVDVAAAGDYDIDFRVFTMTANTQLQLLQGATVLATLDLPTIAAWQHWQTLSLKKVPLTAGKQTLRVFASVGGWNLHWMNFSKE